ncbi:MAG: hypothetical protein HRT38_14375 [Alteromonadaceae bacterium]|nr:hypothetical protein [Alteromonadaceae bacterium]
MNTTSGNLSVPNNTESLSTGEYNKGERINNIVPNNGVTVSISKIGLALYLEFAAGANGSGGFGGANGGGNRPP